VGVWRRASSVAFKSPSTPHPVLSCLNRDMSEIRPKLRYNKKNVQMHPCVWHLPYKPQFELYVGLPPTSAVNESYGVVTGATFPLLREMTQLRGFFDCFFSRREGPGLWGNPDGDRTFDATIGCRLSGGNDPVPYIRPECLTGSHNAP